MAEDSQEDNLGVSGEVIAADLEREIRCPAVCSVSGVVMDSEVTEYTGN